MEVNNGPAKRKNIRSVGFKRLRIEREFDRFPTHPPLWIALQRRRNDELLVRIAQHHIFVEFHGQLFRTEVDRFR